MKFISYLNMHRSRLGYVNCVLLVADVQLDSPIALRRRLETLLFQPIVEHQPEFKAFEDHLKPGSLERLDKQIDRRSLRKAKRTRTGVFAETSSRAFGPRAYDISDLWLLEKNMRSEVGGVLREDSGEPIELAKDLGFLSSGYALTQFGQMAKLVLLERTGESLAIFAEPNPLVIYDDIRLRLLYLYALFESDIVFPAMLVALGRGYGVEEGLKQALDQLVGQIDQGLRLDEVVEARGLYKLRERIRKIRVGRTGTSTETPVDKAQRVPRLEFCVDLGLLDRESSRKKGEDGSYLPTEPLKRAPIVLEGLVQNPGASSVWLDREFFGAAGALYEHSLRPIEDPDVRLLYFVRGSRFVKRRVGFVPGRVAAMVGCLLAWMDGRRLEIAQTFEQVYAVPKGPWADYIKFSGGSRLDSEFLVVVNDDLESRLTGAGGTSQGS